MDSEVSETHARVRGTFASERYLRRRRRAETSLELSNNCQSLARRLLVDIFNPEALSVCSSISEKLQPNYKKRPDARPNLDEHACLVLLSLVIKHGLKRGWNTNALPILRDLHDKVKEMRSRVGVQAQC
ncbi:Putative BEN domain-containing protein B1 [Eumeta japonica]|uniref:BEN domain-containing protein B1 n=1 Tax=Eumeta variegata TaxID=151549 RepID=A0A4C1ZEU9_EUMVA|nr:Putative BEN domain-containing protein B1 [Eumeta japonica]